MTCYQVIYTQKALKHLALIPKKTAKRILDKVKFYRQQSNPLQFAKKLKHAELGTYRFRIGDYRAIFDIDEKWNLKILLILSIKHRKEIYKN